jgi:hypothetical protein
MTTNNPDEDEFDWLIDETATFGRGGGGGMNEAVGTTATTTPSPTLPPDLLLSIPLYNTIV